LKIAHSHDRALTELPLDLCEGVTEGDLPFVLRCHYLPSPSQQQMLFVPSLYGLPVPSGWHPARHL
jgi:hypothetical protein